MKVSDIQGCLLPFVDHLLTKLQVSQGRVVTINWQQTNKLSVTSVQILPLRPVNMYYFKYLYY